MSDRPLKIRLHANRLELRKGSKAWPWTIHTSRACTRAREVLIRIHMDAEYRPGATQPRLFLTGKGYVVSLGKGLYALTSTPQP